MGTPQNLGNWPEPQVKAMPTSATPSAVLSTMSSPKPNSVLGAGSVTPIQPKKPRPKINVKLLIILAVVFLLLAGGAYAWFFTDLKYKLPWFRPAEDKLVGMMYDQLAKLDGVDFAVTYKLSVGDRDADVKVDEKKVSDREAKIRALSLKNSLGYAVKYSMKYCQDEGLDLQAFSGQNCDGDTNKAKPKADEFFCAEQETSGSGTMLKNLNTNSLPSLSTGRKWLDLGEMEWEYDGGCLSDVAKKTYSFSLHSTYNDDKITCDEKGCVFNNEDLVGIATSSEFDFLFGEYLNEFDNYISTNFNLQAIFTGSGFSLSQREENKQTLPNVEMSFDGSADLGSMSAKVKAAARVIDDFVYYKVDDFPFIDITQGYKGEWIKSALEDSSELSNMLPDFNEDQNKVIKEFRDFIAKSKDYSVLTFTATGDYLESHGIKSPIFEVQVLPEKVPDWLEDLREVYNDAKTEEKKNFTEEERQKLINTTKKVNENLKISVALHPVTGDLMNLTLNFRIIPPPEAKKFADKQFNSSLSVDMWNQNNPTSPQAPDKFIDQDEISRERLGLSLEAYRDIKQARRLEQVREDLAKYYIKNRKFPEKLSEATKLVTDYQTGQEYKYQVIGNNYHITYQMNDVEQPAKPQKDYGYIGDYYAKNGFFNSISNFQDNWAKGENIADRYSATIQKYDNSRDWLPDSDKIHSDKDVLMAMQQALIAYQTASVLDAYYYKEDSYPESLEALWSSESFGYSSYYYKGASYAGENLLSGQVADYQPISNYDYTIKFDFPVAASDIDAKALQSNKYYLTYFQAGENVFNKTNIKNTVTDAKNAMDDVYTDSDKDGLTNADEKKYGTDPYLKDTDGDGYWDGEEVKNGYNPKGSGKLASVPYNPTSLKYVPVSASDWVRGTSKAAVTIIVYSDLDCPYCKNFYATINKLYTEYGGKLRLVYRHFPLAQLHPAAIEKAEALECVGEQGGNAKVWSFLDKYYESATSPALNELSDIVKDMGLDTDKFQTCLDSGKYLTKISAQGLDAQNVGARGTPFSLLIKGDNIQLINGAYLYQETKKMIEALLK